MSIRAASQNFYKDVEGAVDVKVKLAGLEPGDYVVELKQDGKDEAAPPQTIQHDGKDRVRTLAFRVKLDKVGQRTLTASVTPARGHQGGGGVEQPPLDRGERGRRPGAGAARRWRGALGIPLPGLGPGARPAGGAEEDRVRPAAPRGSPRPRGRGEDGPARAGVAQGAREPFGDLGCVILGDVDAAKLPLAERQKLERFVAEAGGTLVIVAGKRAMPLAFPEATPAGEADPLRRLLPIESPRLLAPEDGFALSLTRAGEAQKFMELENDRAENAALWAGHPRPWGWAVAGTAKPGAVALAGWLDPADQKLPPTQRERRNAVIVRHNYGFGRVLFVGLDSTWRLRYKGRRPVPPSALGADRALGGGRPPAHGGQRLRAFRHGPAGLPPPASRSTSRPASPRRPARSRPTCSPGHGSSTFRRTRKRRWPWCRWRACRRGRGCSTASYAALPPGRYALELAIPSLADKLADGQKPLRASFTVLDDESREMTRLETNAALLDELASRSGGRVFRGLGSGGSCATCWRRRPWSTWSGTTRSCTNGGACWPWW